MRESEDTARISFPRPAFSAHLPPFATARERRLDATHRHTAHATHDDTHTPSLRAPIPIRPSTLSMRARAHYCSHANSPPTANCFHLPGYPDATGYHACRARLSVAPHGFAASPSIAVPVPRSRCSPSPGLLHTRSEVSFEIGLARVRSQNLHVPVAHGYEQARMAQGSLRSNTLKMPGASRWMNGCGARAYE